MSVGGKITAIKDTKTESGVRVKQYTVIDGNDTTNVMAEPAEKEPAIGDVIWWQGNKIYWDDDRQFLNKVGFSF